MLRINASTNIVFFDYVDLSGSKIKLFSWFQGDSCWLCLGESSFIKVPTEKALSFLKEDVKTIEETVNFTREELKKKVDEVRRIEGSKNLSELGFLLRPVY